MNTIFKIVRNIFVVILLFGIGYFLFRVNTHKGHFLPGAIAADSVYIFPGLKGPTDTTVVQPMHPSTWKKYSTGEDYGIAILLLDTTTNNWMGLVHSFKSFGIPFKIYTNVDEALKNDVVYVYPSVNAGMNGATLAKLAAFPQHGGTLIGQCIEGGLDEVFGFRQQDATTTNFKVDISDFDNPILQEFTDPKEREISFGNSQTYRETIGTYNYKGLLGKPLMVYPNNGQAFMTERDFPGGGRAFAFGTDLGFFTLMCENEQSYDAFRTYVNSYEPTMDVLIRILKNIYISGSKTAVTLGTVPENKKLTVCITHDIDYLYSVFNAVEYAKMESKRNVRSTYFMQTKYIRDWNDLAFFNDSAVGCLRQLDSMKMEIASHSESHSRMYKDFPIGTGREEYPTYHPIVKSKYVTVNGTVLGELRVSKFLIDHFITNTKVVSFRPGHLSLPFSLPQCLEATGYKYSSDVTANDVLTHLPYQLNYGRVYDEELPVFEFPITIEDEAPPHMDQRLDSALAVAHKISKYGGFWCTLIHPNILDYKYKFEQEFLDSIQNIAYITTMRDFGDWWSARNEVKFYVQKNGTGYDLHINTPVPISNLTFFVPATWTCQASGQTAEQTGNSVYVKDVSDGMTLNFSAK